MIEVEFQGQRLRFENGTWKGDPLLTRYLKQVTAQLLDRESIDYGCAVPNAEQALVEATMAHVVGKVVLTTDPSAS